MVILLLVALFFYFLLPISLILIPEEMNQSSFVYGIPWAWLYAFFQIPMTWFFCLFYHRMAKKMEEEMEKIGEGGF